MRIGMMSFAHMHALSYAACLRRLPNVHLVGIADDDAGRGQHMADRFETRYFPSYQALLAEELDGVIICAENAQHRRLTELAATATRHILCEKPIATNLADARAMLQACAARGTKLQTAFPMRFSPPMQQLKELLDEQKLGRVYAVTTTNHGRMPGGWFTNKAAAGGGAVIDHTVHVIDLLRWFWNIEVTEVYAEVGQELLHPGAGIDDVGLLSFKLANGVFGTLDTSWSRPASYPIWGDVKIKVIGEGGILAVDFTAQHLAIYSEATGKGEWVFWGSSPDLGLMQDFVAMIDAGREPSISGEDGLKALEVALAAYQSALLGRPVSLPLGE